MLNASELANIRAAAESFRAAIVACTDPGLIGLNDFPNGACGDASPLLGQHLYDEGLGTWEYVSGERAGDHWSHAWIENDGVIVDITADQFDDIDAEVIVTRDHEWHRQFRSWRDSRHIARLDAYDEHTRKLLTTAYERITSASE